MKEKKRGREKRGQKGRGGKGKGEERKRKKEINTVSGGKYFNVFSLIGGKLIYNVVLFSAMQQRELDIIYIASLEPPSSPPIL